MDATEQLPAAAGGALVLGRYRLERRIGSGGFGTVFEARDERLDRPVAVKVVPAGGHGSDRGAREALAAARLHHPGIVAVFDAGEDARGRYLVSELVRGRTLDRLEADGALSDRDVLRVGLALAEALGHAHERGVVHRDVKPQNVIVPDDPEDRRGAAKLADFGIAHLAGDEALTRTGDVVGTLAYMAPEQAAGERVDARVDLYSLALVLYEALAGSNPVRASGPAATARRVGSVLPALRRRRRDLPAGLCEAIDRAVAPEPAARGTLTDLAAALAGALPEVSDEGGTIAPHPLERARGSRLFPLIARVFAALAAAALVAAALAAAGDAGTGLGGGGEPVPGGEGPRTSEPSPGGAGEPPIAPLAGSGIAAVLVALFPRAGWLLAAAGCVAALAGPRPETAALVASAAAVPPLLMPRSGLAWSLPAVAPALGLAGLAGAYPAIAGRVRGAWTRAALGATGAWWLLLAEPALDRDLALGTAPGESGEVLEALATSGALLLAPLWAAAALVLPFLVAGRALAVDLAGAAVWSAGLGVATAAVAERASFPEPRGLVVGAILAGAVAAFGARAPDTVITGHESR
jgi:eukaryotic-like serine/threonine-protein kinase